ncbi:MAG TPA: 30S ribosomal protein S11 [Gammaproteobacteria bacterium]|nr:30S ribosomal protein S11 [Gammaproteobacteria bacterium]
MPKTSTSKASGSKPTTAARARKKVKRTVTTGIVHIFASFNNTIVTVTDSQGNTITWQTAGAVGFKGARKSTPYAAQMTAKKAIVEAIALCGLKSVDVEVCGPGPGRESAVRALGTEGIVVLRITDRTGVPHNGCRPSKERRV